MATIQPGANTVAFTTAAGDKTTADAPFTPINALMIAMVAATGKTGTFGGTDTNTDGLGTTPGYFAIATSAFKNTNVDQMTILVRSSLAGVNNSSQTFTTTGQAASTGGGVDWGYITGMSLTGSSAVRQVAVQSNQALGATATVTLGAAPLTTNCLLCYVLVTTNGTTMAGPTGWTASASSGYGTPATGFRAFRIDSGFTSTTVTCTGTYPSAGCMIVVEFDTTAPPATKAPPFGMRARRERHLLNRFEALAGSVEPLWKRRFGSGLLVPQYA